MAAIIDNTLHRTDCAYDKYIFVNYKEYVLLSEEEIKNRLELIPDRRIILLNTGEIFEAPYIACNQLNIENSHLSQTLNHICEYCGEDKIYHDDLVFKRMTEYDPKEKVQLFLRSKGDNCYRYK